MIPEIHTKSPSISAATDLRELCEDFLSIYNQFLLNFLISKICIKDHPENQIYLKVEKCF